LGGDTEPQIWVNKIVGDDRNLASFLENFLEKDVRHKMIKVRGGQRYRLNHRVLESYLEPENLLDRVRTLAGSAWLSETQMVALEQFLEIYEPKGH
jgi:hypothetical protein